MIAPETELQPTRPRMRRNLLILALGIGFLVVMTFAATTLETIIPRKPSPQQTAQLGNYQLTFQVSPNPPPSTRTADLSFHLQQQGHTEPLTNAHIVVTSTMESMDMGTDLAEAHIQPDGNYVAQAHFTMSGAWQVHVKVSLANGQTLQTNFEVTAQ